MNTDILKTEITQDLNVVAEHVVALIHGIAKGYLDLADVDLQKLAETVNAINNIIDGDPDSEGFQNFLILQQKVNALEGTSEEHTQSIKSLQDTINNVVNAKIEAIAEEGKVAREQLDSRISQLATQHSNHVASQALKNSQYDNQLTDHEIRVKALEAARVLHLQKIDDLESRVTKNTSDIDQLKQKTDAAAAAINQERQRAEGEEALLREELVTERGRIDQLTTDSQNLITRQELADVSKHAWTAFCKKLWVTANMQMKAGLILPDGTAAPLPSVTNA